MKTKKMLFVVLLIIEVGAAFVDVHAKEKRPRPEVSPYGETLLVQINQYRQENGLNMLRFEPRLVRLARSHSLEMSQQKRVSHYNFEKRMKMAASRLCIENVGWNNNAPQKRFDDWQQSPDNNRNMLAEGIVKAGIAEVGSYVTFIACR